MSDFYGFEQKNIEFDGKSAIIVFANAENRTDKWLLKTEYFGAFPELEVMMLKEGYNIAHIENTTRWCLFEDTKRRADFCEFLHREYEFNKKCVPVGMSCGGMQAIYFASEFPQYVSAMYLDAPVINFLSCPAGLGKAGTHMFEEFKKAKSMDLVQLIAYRNHPMDKFCDLAKEKIPIILVSGDSDTEVPFDENGELLYRFAKENNIPIELHIKKGGDHHPHGLPDNTIIRDFIKTYY